eukprot:14932081-Ditylum_brightwellii.AAC.1
MMINDTMLDVLNGSIIGLCYDPNGNHNNDGNTRKSNVNDCTDDNSDTSSSSSHTTNEQKHSTILSCVGLGVLRSIDCMHTKFYILTSVPFQNIIEGEDICKSCSGVSSGGLPSYAPSLLGMVSNDVLSSTSLVGGDLMEGRNNMN